MDPYVTKPEHIPATDLYADVPLYGRYRPKPGDFSVKPEHVGCQSSAAMRYWESIVSLCDESTRIYPADEGGRDVVALGNIIVKSSHLHDAEQIDYSFADSNEVDAIPIAKDVLRNIRVPEIYFAGKIRGRQVLIQERLPGVVLSVAWPYLSQRQKQSFKEQARAILRQLHTIKPHDGRRVRSHIVQDPKILSNGRINPLEGEIIFSDANTDPDLSFMHNDFAQSNCIVDNDKIVGLGNGWILWLEDGWGSSSKDSNSSKGTLHECRSERREPSGYYVLERSL